MDDAAVALPKTVTDLGFDPAAMAQLDQTRAAGQDIQKRWDTERAPAEQAVNQAAQQLQGAVDSPAQQVPVPTNNAHHMNPKELTDSAQSFMTLGALAGLLTRRPMTSALKNMTAAMKGVQEGDDHQYKVAYDAYKTDFDKAMATNKQMLDEKEKVVKDRNLSLTSRESQLHLIDLKYGNEVGRNTKTYKEQLGLIESQQKASQHAADLAARLQEHHDNLIEHDEDRRSRLAQAQEFHDDLKHHWDETAARMKEKDTAKTDPQTRRILNSVESVAGDLRSLVDRPITSSSGFFGQHHSTTTIFGAGQAALANALGSQDVQIYNTEIAGLGRSLATIESSGAASGLVGLSGLVNDQVMLKLNDTQMTKLHKFAQVRQIAETGLLQTLNDKRTTPENRALLQDALESIKTSVPFTHLELDKLERDQKANPNKTLYDVMTELKGKEPSAAGEAPAGGSAPPEKNAKGWVLHKDARGNMAYVGPNNEVEEVK